MLKTLLLSALMAGGVAVAAHAQPAMDRATHDFVAAAAQSDDFERVEGRLAETQGKSPDVRKFAAEMVRAHTQTTEGLKAAIRKAGFALPPPPVLSGDQTRMISDLRGRHGGDFDHAYHASQQLCMRARDRRCSSIQGYAQNGHPGPIRDAARQAKPLVQRHIDMIHHVQAHIGA